MPSTDAALDGCGARMILGVGTDLAQISRIARVMGRFEARFLARVFTQNEQNHARNLARYAKIWAAKEAAAKALGCGISGGVTFLDFDVHHLETGQPVIMLCGVAAQRLGARLPFGHEAAIHLSLSDDGDFAQAFVVIEAVPIGSRLDRPARAAHEAAR